HHGGVCRGGHGDGRRCLRAIPDATRLPGADAARARRDQARLRAPRPGQGEQRRAASALLVSVPVRTADFDYQLPPELIAQHPPAERDAARMLVLDRSNGLVDRSVRDLPEYLEAGDVLVLNDSRVLQARLIGRRRGGGEAEVLLLRPLPEGHSRWEALIRRARRLETGSQVTFENSALAVAIAARDGETATVRLDGVADPLSEVRRIGAMPPPPYLKE